MSITFEGEWVGNQIWDGIIIPNTWTMSIQFGFLTNDSYIQYITVERLRYFVNELLNGSCFAHINEPIVEYLHKKTKNHIITLPMDVADHSIAAAILYKCQTFCEEYVEFYGISISSIINPDIGVFIDAEDLIDLYPSLIDNTISNLAKDHNGWWTRDDASSTDIILRSKNRVDIKSDKTPWDELNLSWEQPREEQPVKIEPNLITRGWTPSVINGGKHNK